MAVQLFSTEDAAIRAGYHGERIGKSFTDIGIKRLGLSPAEIRKTKNGRDQYFWTQEQIDAVIAYRAANRKKSSSVKTAPDNDETKATQETMNLFDDTTAPMNDDEPAQNTPPADVVIDVDAVNTATDTPDTSTAESDADVPALVEEVVTLADRADRIRKLQADVQRGIIEIGSELLAAKKEIGHGGWGDWLETQFQWTQRTANNFMRIAERFGDGKLENVFQFQPSTLQAMLALPDDTEQKFIDEQAAAGRPVETQSAREVKRNVDEFKRRHADTDDDAQQELSGKTFDIGDSKLVVPDDDDRDVTADTPDEKKYAELIIDKEFSTILPPLKDYEFKLLEESILKFGILSPLCVWNCILLDGHARYEIAKRHNLPFKICEVKSVNDRDDATIWIIENQLCRRNLSEFDRVKLVLECEKILNGDANETN